MRHKPRNAGTLKEGEIMFMNKGMTAAVMVLAMATAGCSGWQALRGPTEKITKLTYREWPGGHVPAQAYPVAGVAVGSARVAKVVPKAAPVITPVVVSAPVAAAPCGAVIGYHKGIPIMSNGKFQGTPNSCTGREGFYQCVEFARRYYQVAKGVDTSTWRGDAATWFTTAEAKGLTAVPNNSPQGPEVDDIMVFGGTPGHVCVVSSVGENTIECAEQNGSLTGAMVLPVQYASGSYYVGPRKGGRAEALGWLHLTQPVTGPGRGADGDTAAGEVEVAPPIAHEREEAVGTESETSSVPRLETLPAPEEQVEAEAEIEAAPQAAPAPQAQAEVLPPVILQYEFTEYKYGDSSSPEEVAGAIQRLTQKDKTLAEHMAPRDDPHAERNRYNGGTVYGYPADSLRGRTIERQRSLHRSR